MFTRARSARRGLGPIPIVPIPIVLVPILLVSLVLTAGEAGAVPDLVPLHRAAAIADRLAQEGPADAPSRVTSPAKKQAAEARVARRRAAARRRLTSKQRFGFRWPVKGWVTSGFGRRAGGFHHGLDIACAKMTPILPSMAGRVVYSAHIPIYGKTVVVRHRKGYETLYAHLAVRQVTSGKRVTRNTTLGKCGSTGNSTGSHVHFEIRRKGRWFNPRWFLR